MIIFGTRLLTCVIRKMDEDDRKDFEEKNPGPPDRRDDFGGGYNDGPGYNDYDGPPRFHGPGPRGPPGPGPRGFGPPMRGPR